MKIGSLLFIAVSLCLLSPQAKAAGCDNVEPMTKWRQCMGDQNNKMAKAIAEKSATLNEKVYTACKAKSIANGSDGPAAIDEALICSATKLSAIIEAMR